MREIGWMYANGRGVTADPATALGWFQEAAIAGDERAMLILGTALARGLNIEKQPEAATIGSSGLVRRTSGKSPAPQRMNCASSDRSLA